MEFASPSQPQQQQQQQQLQQQSGTVIGVTERLDLLWQTTGQKAQVGETNLVRSSLFLAENAFFLLVFCFFPFFVLFFPFFMFLCSLRVLHLTVEAFPAFTHT